MTPTRFHDAPQVHALYGARVAQLGAALSRTDPLADAVVLAFRELPKGEGWAVRLEGIPELLIVSRRQTAAVRSAISG